MPVVAAPLEVVVAPWSCAVDVVAPVLVPAPSPAPQAINVGGNANAPSPTNPARSARRRLMSRAMFPRPPYCDDPMPR